MTPRAIVPALITIMSLLVGSHTALGADIASLRNGLEEAFQSDDYEGAIIFGKQVIKNGGSENDYLLLAGAYKNSYRINEALAVYEAAARRFPTLRVYGAWTEYLLALGLFNEALPVVEAVQEQYPEHFEPRILRAMWAALQGRDTEAVGHLLRAHEAGATPIHWIDSPFFEGRAMRSPYADIISPADILIDLKTQSQAAQLYRVRILSAMDLGEHVQDFANFLLDAENGSVLRAGMEVLDRPETDTAAVFSYLLDHGNSRLRREVLRAMWRRPHTDYLAIATAHLPSEAAHGNRDFTRVLVARLQALGLGASDALDLYAAIPADNTYRYLATWQTAELFESLGMSDAATAALSEATRGRPVLSPAGDKASEIERYWECMEREDMGELGDLLQYHNAAGRIDARVYGLPENDFDDTSMLSIAERLFLRDRFNREGKPLPTEGQRMYPREIRHWLRQFYRTTGMVPDCSGFLTPKDDFTEGIALLAGDGEVKLFEDTTRDTEVNIVVNPYDQRYLVATSNDYDGALGDDLYYSSDWGKTWTVSDVPSAYQSCDPVSYYTRTGGQDVVYHSSLTSDINAVEMSYSTDNGVSWTACASPVLAESDRQDHVVDTDPDSGCYNTIYVAYQDYEQYIVTSTGATFPYCQSWSAPYVTSTGGNTFGSAMVVSPTFGQPSGTDAIVHNIAAAWRVGDIIQVTSDNCGSSWTEQTIYNLSHSDVFRWGIPAMCRRKVSAYTQADSDRQASSEYRNNIYVAWNDLSSTCSPPDCDGNITCNGDIYLGIGIPDNRDDPTTWSWQAKVNLTAPGGPIPSDAYTDEFFPSLTVDQADGALYLSFYRSGSGAGGIQPRKTEVHYYVAKSIDGGSTWELHRVTELPTDESGSGANVLMQWGDYTWNDVINGVCHPSWTDRRELEDEDIWAAKVCSEPTHWSERSPAFAAPPTNAVAGSPLQVDIDWKAPDLYWGDGGENNSLRKYQLWVDGTMEIDNIPWTDTTVSWDASECSTPHDLIIRAINQCGTFKDYAAASGIVAAGCCSQNPNVDVTPDGLLFLCEGVDQLLTAGVSGGTGPFSYQWTRDGVDITGETGPTYAAGEAAGSYAFNCKVTGQGCGDYAVDPSSLQVSWENSPPFGGITTVTNPFGATCTLDLTWDTATAACPGATTYAVYRSTTSPVSIIPANKIVSGLTGTAYSDTTGLIGDTTYYYVVRSTIPVFGEDGNTVEMSGTTNGPGGGQQSLFFDDFEGAVNWTFAGKKNDWEIGAPQGLGGSFDGRPDPSAAVSGTNVMGNDLSGNGDYGDRMESSTATLTNPIDCSNVSGAHLEFQRWLGVEAGDSATIYVSNNGTEWTEVWQSPSSLFWSTDTVWTPWSIDISAIADNQATVHIRFEIVSNDTNGFCGWNLDDVEVTGWVNAACDVGVAPPGEPSDVQGAVESPLYILDKTSAFEVEEQANADTYNIYEGSLGSWDTFDAVTCHIAGTVEAGRVTLDHMMMPGSHWYRISASNAIGESSIGKDNTGAPIAGTCGANP